MKKEENSHKLENPINYRPIDLKIIQRIRIGQCEERTTTLSGGWNNNGKERICKKIKIFAFLVTLTILSPMTVFAGAVPDTGLTSCYSAVGDSIPCPGPGQPFYGQDAQYNGSQHSYTKLGQNSVVLPDSATPSDGWIMTRDNVTGLIWEIKQNMDGNANYLNLHDSDNTYRWYDSNTATNYGDPGYPGNGYSTFDTEKFIDGLNSARFGGYSDWRLPTIQELGYLIDSSVKHTAGPAINKSFFPNTQYDINKRQYCSSTNDGERQWDVDFSLGNVSYWIKTPDSPNYLKEYYVRAVRGPRVISHFIDNNNGTVTDTNTGLMWQKNFAPEFLSWQDALSYCENLTLAGYSDWRLPNRNEFLSIIDLYINQYEPTVLYDPEAWGAYWTSTTDVNSVGVTDEGRLLEGEALVFLHYGEIDSNCEYSSKIENLNPVRAVRGGGSVVYDIKANGSDGPLSIRSTNNLSITVELSAGGLIGHDADWWLAANTPFGWFYYQPEDNSWKPGLIVSFQGPLFNLEKIEVINILGLLAGDYTFYFGGDIDMNGSLDMDKAYYDCIKVSVMP